MRGDPTADSPWRLPGCVHALPCRSPVGQRFPPDCVGPNARGSVCAVLPARSLAARRPGPPATGSNARTATTRESVAGVHLWPSDRSVRDGQLVAQCEDLYLQSHARPDQADGKREQGANDGHHERGFPRAKRLSEAGRLMQIVEKINWDDAYELSGGTPSTGRRFRGGWSAEPANSGEPT
jgi:hypothetical protein